MTDNRSKLAIEVKQVSKSFGKFLALNDVSIKAERAKVTGLLGPNGAGKSTLIKIMTTLLNPTSGEVIVEGINVVEDPSAVRERIGLAGQYAAIDDFLTGRETLEMVGRLYHLPKNIVKQRAIELLDQLGLTNAADHQTKTYSGGMRRRLDLGASLVATPKVLFLDEPTTGLDPRTRKQLWDIIRDLVNKGVSILLTTQYLEEADALADYMYVIDQGKLITEGTSEQLKRSLGKDIIEIKVDNSKLETASSLLKKEFIEEINVDEITRKLSLRTLNGSEDLLKISSILKKSSIKPEELSLHRPSLDDVFLAVTGNGKEEKK